MGRIMLLVAVAAPMAAPLALAGMAWAQSLGPRAPPSRWIRPRRSTGLTRRHSSRNGVKKGDAP